MSAWPGRTPGWRRTLVLLLAFAALGFVVLRPLCESALAAHHADPNACCAVAQDGTFVKSTDPLASAKPSFGGVVPAAAALLVFGTIFSMPRPRVPASASPAQSFYLRSARIRR